MAYVFSFGEGKADGVEKIPNPPGSEKRKAVLGGKGAGLADMTAAGVPVPPGFTLSCQACLRFQEEGALPAEIDREMEAALALLERRMGRELGDPKDPLLVSVRSGAPKSMPGMMDTVLNLGLTPATVEGVAARTRNRRFAFDAYRRFLAMFGNVVLGIEKAAFDRVLDEVKRHKGVSADVELSGETLEREVVPAFAAIVEKRGGREVLVDVKVQLRAARDAVFRSWNNPRAVEYRRQFAIPDDLGTAVNVQAMVFGNMGESSGTGVGFTRNPGTGEREFFGEFLQNAQGEDVVAGIRTPRPIAELAAALPQAYARLHEITARLERTYRWPQDFEFTVEEGRLWMLQTRDAKCTARAALRWAIDLLEQGILGEEEALLRVEPASLDQLLHPVFDPAARAKVAPIATGLAAGPGAAAGELVLSAAEAVKRARAGKKVVLVRAETCPDDIAGMIAAQGVLTATGGRTSHAAVVGRQLGKPCVVGASALTVDEHEKVVRVGGRVLAEGDAISVDGTTGEVLPGLLPTMDSEVLRGVSGELDRSASQLFDDYLKLMELADRYKTLDVRTNADRPEDAAQAVRLGARGIGLCRTEHMFFEDGRIPIVQRMILAAPRAREGLLKREAAEAKRENGDRARAEQELAAVDGAYGEAIRAYRGALAELLPLQREDFYGIFREMRGHPVTIRTLDPPLHEFLPKREELLVAREALEGGRVPASARKLLAQLDPVVKALEGKKRLSRKERLEAVLRRVEELHEFNPMLGHRGCRLGITYPEITEMQARAIFEAAAKCRKEGREVRPEIMVPLVGTEKELADQKRLLVRTLAAVEKEKRVRLEVKIGTMIEVPRAALAADEIAREAEFFSFGTNDLTQLTFGYSRDDVGRFLHHYLEARILPRDPFLSIDPAVGRLMKLAVEGGRATRPDLKLGICGEHGGDPASIELCQQLGLAYVSCSPFRVPVARLAAAHAALRAARATREADRKRPAGGVRVARSGTAARLGRK